MFYRATRLISKRVEDVSNAAAHFGNEMATNDRERQVPVVLIPRPDSCKFWITIPEGMHALVQSYGRFIGIWPAGFHFARPWEQVSHLVTKQFIVFDTPVKECPTLDNVMVEIDVSVIFHIIDDPESVKNFVFHLGPERLQQMLTAFQEEAVRTMARKKTYQKIYDLMDTDDIEEIKASLEAQYSTGGDGAAGKQGGVEMAEVARPALDDEKERRLPPGAAGLEHREQLENTKRMINEKLQAYGVKVYSITITNVRLPDAFAKEMEQATIFQSKNAYAQIEQKYNIQVINDDEKQRQLAQKLREDRQERQTRAEQDQAAETKKLRAIQAETERQIAAAQEVHKAEILKLQAESELRVEKFNQQAQIKLASIRADAEGQARAIMAEKEAYEQVTRASAALRVAQNRAETLKLQAAAEKLAAEKLKQKREYEAMMQQLLVLKNLAQNRKLVVSGRNQDSVIAQLVGAREAAAVLALNPAQ